MLTPLAVANYRSLRSVVVPLTELNIVSGDNGIGRNADCRVREYRTADTVELCEVTSRYYGARRMSAARTQLIPETLMGMNRDIAGGNFKQLKGKIKEQWGKLTDDEIDQMEGHAEILAGKLQERYGLARDDAERQARDFQTRNNWQ